MSLLSNGLLAAALTRGALLDRASAQPRSRQLATLRHLLARAKRTRFGRDHAFARIRTYGDFQRAVPLRDYGALAPWLTRAFEGEPDVTWPGTIPYFGMSSGTTGGNKYLPISHALIRCQQRAGFDPIAAYVRAGGAKDILDAKAILLGSTTELERRASGVLIGDNTGIMARHMPRWVRSKHLPSPAVRALTDWDAKIERLAQEAVGADVRLIAGTPAWFSGLFDEVLRVARKRGLPSDRVLDVWPKLRLLTGGGVRYDPYRPLIEARLGGSVPYLDVYNATEGGIMGVQDRLHVPGMRLMPDRGVFYEFVPLDSLHAREPERLGLWQVEVGRTYALALSTPAGLFGYLLGDCVRFTELSPHRFVFEGRSKAFLNVCGEHVSQGELERAVSRACSEQGVSLVDFTVSSQVGRSQPTAAEHVYYIECEGGRPPDLDALGVTIDADVAAGNEDYRVHRRSARALAAPRVQLLRRGSFARWMRARGKLGGQHKVPRVIEDPQLLAALLESSAAAPELGESV